MQKPEIENYYDYRQFLGDLFLWNKEQIPVFSHRYIVQKAGFKSPTLLKDVIDKKKNLTVKSAELFAKAFQLSPHESEYLLLLLRFNTAQTVGEKDRIFNELILLKQSVPHRTIDEAQFSVLDKWWILTLREALALPDYKHSTKWLGRILQKEISPEEVKSALRILKEAGLIHREKGQWHSVDAIIKTEQNVQSVKIARYHQQMIDLAKEALWNVPSEHREISGTTLRIPMEKIDEIKKRLYDLRQFLLRLAEQSEEADQIFQLNFQLFPLVKVDRKERMEGDHV